MQYPIPIGMIVCQILLLASPAAAEVKLERLSQDNWDALVPAGKEVDAIYGDYVLQNDHIVAVIANPLPDRRANLTVGNVGGAVIDLTSRKESNDQLGAFYPGAGVYRFTDPTKVRIQRLGRRVVLTMEADTAVGAMKVAVRYTLSEGDTSLLVENLLANESKTVIEFRFRDMLRADRTFDFGSDVNDHLTWAHDEWFQQAYGIYSDTAVLTQTGTRGVVVSYIWDGQDKIRLTAGQSRLIRRRIFPGRHRLDIIGQGQQLAGANVKPISFDIRDANGPVRNAQFVFSDSTGRALGSARTDDMGQVRFLTSTGHYRVSVLAIGRPKADFSVEVIGPGGENEFTLDVQPCGYLQVQITSETGGPIPCKLSLTGKDGTPSPFYGPDSGTFQVHNCVYTEDGTFKVELGPGTYDVIISRGPEYDAIFTEIEVRANKVTPLRGSLVRTVSTPGWVSTDFHSHSSPSGDNTGSQFGRVLNLLAEHIEFAPCTEHNRISTYAPHLARLSAHKWMATCTGMELTGSLLPVNHQNAFPLVHRPRTQDGGGPRVSDNPITQIKRLAMWDNNSDKLVQENHPNLVRILGDRDEDGKPDAGFRDMLQYMDVVEIHPLDTILQRPGSEVFLATNRNPSFRWLQMLNLGYRISGVVNTDAHYNFHGSGWLRNYVRSATDAPAQIDTMEMVHRSERGQVVMTTGPFLEVIADNGEEKVGPGEDLLAKDGRVTIHIRVQCANWFDVNRVQILINGKLDDRYNFTRRKNGDRFRHGVVKFDQQIPLELTSDAHIVVVTAGEGLQLGPVMGAERGRQMPIAVSNPVFIDRDGSGFEANGDRLGVDLPLVSE
jgi:hypothetical protein